MSRTFITPDGVSADALQKNENFLLENYILTGKSIPVGVFGDNTELAISEGITWLTNNGGGSIHVPADSTHFELDIKVYKDPNGVFKTNFEYYHYRRPTTESRPYTNEPWQVGDIVYNNRPDLETCTGWVCTAAGTPGTWSTFGISENLSALTTTEKNSLVEAINELNSRLTSIELGSET